MTINQNIFKRRDRHNSWCNDYAKEFTTEEKKLWEMYNQYIHEFETTTPPRYKNATWEDVDVKVQNLAQGKEFAQGKGLYIHGPVGTGKTHTLYGMMKKLNSDRDEMIVKLQECRDIKFEDHKVEGNTRVETIDQELLEKKYNLLKEIKKIPPPLRVVGMTALLFEARQSYKTNDDFIEKVINSRKTLLIDDIGVEKVTEWVEEFVYMVVNTRYEECLPTVFTSNLPLSQLAEKIGDRTVSRIKEMCHIVKLDGEDRRLNN